MLTPFDIALAWLRLYRTLEAIYGTNNTCYIMIVPMEMLQEMNETVTEIENRIPKIRLVKG